MILKILNLILVMKLVMQNGVLHAIENGTNSSTRPKEVNVGAIFPFNSTIGKVAKVAIQAAVDDVNASPLVLHGTKLNITMQDTNHSGFLGIVEAMRFMEKNVVAILGPQSSVVAHVVSYLANGLQIPLLSFAATDPTLSSLEYPFFVRTTQNDLFQMGAIADIVNHFGWRKVTAIYNDDDYGRNGVSALEDKLSEKECTISYKAAMNSEPSKEDIKQLLFQVALQESRIIVLHTYNNQGLTVLDVARSLHMLDSGYVWIATDWLTNIIDTDSLLPSGQVSNVQGLITLRSHTPKSNRKKNFTSRWRNLIRGERENRNGLFGLNAYGLYAYDTVWILAQALDEYFRQGGNISFSDNVVLKQLKGGNLHLDTMQVFDGGELLLSNVRRVKMTGLTGEIQFDSDRNLINPAYDIVNLVGTGHITIGYWANSTGLSVQPPEYVSSDKKNSRRRLYGVIWPGQTTEKPRGWVFPSSGKRLTIGVPNRVDYDELITYSESANSFTGYCIDVFLSAVNLLPYALPYKLVPFGNGIDNPSMNELIDKMSAGVFDAVIGDVSITTNRTRIADFTQPYTESGLVVLAQVKTKESNAWAFLRPFSPMMWCVNFGFFVVVGSVVWILEHRHNDEFRGPPRRQIATMLWFTLSTWFFAHKESMVSTLGRVVLIIWLFVVLIINSSYTASLTSILTVQQLTSSVNGIQSLVASNDPIGYREGSFIQDYLHVELGVPESRLVALNFENASAEALRKGPKNGGVAAIVDQKAYAELFLSTRCEFTIVGPEFTKNGWGFAFPRDSQLATDMSTAILRLSENGDLQRIHDKWLQKSACSSQDTQLAVNTLELGSFWGLFLICGVACLLALILYFGLIVRQFMRHYTPEDSGIVSRSLRLQTILSFVDEKEEEIKRRSKRRQMEGSSTRSSTPRYASNKSLSVTPTATDGSSLNQSVFSPPF